MTNRKLTTSQLCFDAMFAAMTALLGYIALDFGTIKITFESFPVLLGALMYGPIDGMIIGGIGTFIYQILKYGLSATTALWMLPYIVIGLAAGLFAQKKNFSNTKKQLLAIIVICEIIAWALNTVVLYIDSLVYSYPYVIVWWMSIVRLAVAAAKGVVFGVIMPQILIKLYHFTGNGAQARRNYH